MDKKKTIIWLCVAVLLMAAALVLRFVVNRFHPLPYMLGVAALVIIFDVFHKNWVIVTGMLAALALVLRFAVRGYAWWGYLAAFIALLVLAHRFFSKPLFQALMVLVGIGFAYFCFVEFFIIREAGTDRDAKRDYLIVLGAAVHGDTPSLTLENRLKGAMEYLEAYPECVVIVSGGQGPGENLTEGAAMRDWLLAKGLEADRILMEDKATSTQENLEFSFALIRERGGEPDGNIAICSSAYHLYRAKQMARNMGVQPVGVSAPWGYPLVMLNYFIREAFGVTHLWVFGY